MRDGLGTRSSPATAGEAVGRRTAAHARQVGRTQTRRPSRRVWAEARLRERGSGPVTRDLRRAFRSEAGGTIGAVIDDSHEQPWRGAENLPRLRAACEGTRAHYQTALAAQNLRGADFAENWQICGQDAIGAPDWCSPAGQLMRGLNGAGEGR